MNLDAMRPWLDRYVRRGDAILLAAGFQWGFRIPFRPRGRGEVHGNLRSVAANPGVALQKIRKEVELGRMAGPFAAPPLEDLRVSPLGVVPKKEPGKFRLIHHLSYPAGSSVNDDIDPELCSVSYTSFDQALAVVKRAGTGAWLAKADIESAFRLLPIHPDCHHLLGCALDGSFYVDLCLPMGCSISCSYFEKFSSFLEWVVRRRANSKGLVHYLDDFLCVGPAVSDECQHVLETLEEVAAEFGVPFAPEKTVGPVTCLCFLGLEIDTLVGECRLPADKLVDLRSWVDRLQCRRKATVREIQSLLGKLNFACRVIVMGRVFCRRLGKLLMGALAPHHHVRLPTDVRDDLAVWRRFLDSFNGRLIFPESEVTSTELRLYTDAAGSHGFGAYLDGGWCAAAWPAEWTGLGLTRNLCFLEMFPIVVALFIWGDVLSNKRVIFVTDNMGVVQAINKQSASSVDVVRLLRVLVLRCLQLNVGFRAVHLPGVRNDIADSLSRFQWERFRRLAPTADLEGQRFPERLWRLGTSGLEGW